MALTNFKKNKSLFINSCDVFSLFDIKQFLMIKKSDIIVFLSSKSFVNLKTEDYTWAKTQGIKIKKLYIKKKPKEAAKIITGNFYFKNKEIFNTCYNNTIFRKKEMYIDEIINSAIKLGFRVKFIEDKNYINLGTPKLIKNFNYWHNFFKKNA